MDSFPLLVNIGVNVHYLTSDFQSFIPSVISLGIIFLSVVIAFSLLLLMLCIGERIRGRWFKDLGSASVIPFLNFAFGYIFVGTALAILGTFSLFSPFPIAVFLAGLSIVSFSRITTVIRQFREVRSLIHQQWKEQTILSGIVFGFVIIAFLRLIPPETNVDALWYHTDLPHVYVQEKTMMIQPNYQYHLVPIPQLGEMLYVITEVLDIKDASRYIQYLFYLAVVMLVIVAGSSKLYKTSGLLAALFFVSAPVTIRHASSALANFQWILCLLLSVIILLENRVSKVRSIASGILLGGVFATKLWTVAFFPAFLIFFFLLFRKQKNSGVSLVLFLVFSLLVPLVWYLRSFILTGNPVYPAFAQDEWFFPQVPGVGSYFSLEAIRFRLLSLFNWSPLFLMTVGIAAFLINSVKKTIRESRYSLVLIIISVCYIILPFYFGHYLYLWYVLLILFFGLFAGIILRIRLYRFILTFFSSILLLYYGINTILTVPYGLGLASDNAYLTRVLSRDNSSYYNYGFAFSKWYTQSEPVAVYGLWGFYYAEFEPRFVVDIFRRHGASLQSLRDLGIQKLIIKGGDMQWFCKTLRVSDCGKDSYELLAKYEFTYAPASQYLYKLE